MPRPLQPLVQGVVEYAASKKQFPVEPDRDQGVGWLIPKPTRAHPTPPKLILSCGYAPPIPVPVSANAPGSPRKPTENFDLAIPASAAGSECETCIRNAESRSESYCSKAVPSSSSK